MNQKQIIPPPAPGVTLEDVYYVLFRRKWLILTLSVAGFIAAGVANSLMRPMYVSTAEIQVNDILVPKGSPTPGVQDVVTYEQRALMETECESLKSMDLARAAVNTMGPARILGKAVMATNVSSIITNITSASTNYSTNYENADQAAVMIKNSLTADVVNGSKIIAVTYRNEDADIPQQVVQQVINAFMAKHDLMKQQAQAWQDSYSTELTTLDNQIKNAEKQIAAVKSLAGAASIAQEQAGWETEKATLQAACNATSADLASLKARAEQIKKQIPASLLTETTNAASTNVMAPRSAVMAFKRINDHLQRLEADADKYANYNPTNTLVLNNIAETDKAEADRESLLKKYPGLEAAAQTDSKPSGPDWVGEYNEAVDGIAGYEARLNSLSNSLVTVLAGGTNINQLDATVKDLERNKELDEEEYRQIKIKMIQSTLDNAAAGLLNADLIVSEAPTPPAREIKKTIKVVGSLAGGGVVAGLGLAWLLEMVLVRSFKRPKDIAARLSLPFFLTIPRLNGNGKLHLPKPGRDKKLLPADTNGSTAAAPDATAVVPAGRLGPLPPWDEKHALRPYNETLRDRLIAFFELNNLTHKPKLVAVTSCNEGAGVSTIASGLACALSETGDGNVLLVNMNAEEGEAHHFYKGKLTLGLDEVLDQKEKRGEALVQDNLYVVKESSKRDQLPSVLPKRFGHLVSKLKSSDYDYIIFDMPTVTQISVTPRLARFMDMVLLVVEAEKTDRDVAQRATALLSESRANVGVIMNKNRAYVPRRLQQEF